MNTDKVLNTLPLALVIGLLVLLVVWTTNQPEDTFPTKCATLGGHVYTMDADHRVCLKHGEVIHVG